MLIAVVVVMVWVLEVDILILWKSIGSSAHRLYSNMQHLLLLMLGCYIYDVLYGETFVMINNGPRVVLSLLHTYFHTFSLVACNMEIFTQPQCSVLE